MYKNFEKKEQKEFGPVFLVTMQKTHCQKNPVPHSLKNYLIPNIL